MKSNSSCSRQIYAAVFLISAAVIAFQIILLQILSFCQWHHFAYMIISIALLGFGAAGTSIAILKKSMIKYYAQLMFSLSLFFSAAIIISTYLVNLPVFSFDSYLLFTDFNQMYRFALNCFLFFIPFFTGALAIGLTFVRFPHNIGKLYSINLIGSGAGGVSGLILMFFFVPQYLPVAIALFPMIAALILIPGKRHILYGSAIGILSLLVIFTFISPPEPAISEYKSLSKTLTLPDAKIVYEKNSPSGLIQVVSSPALRNAPCLSLTYEKAVPVRDAVFNNGSFIGSQVFFNNDEDRDVMNYSLYAVPYSFGKRKSIAVLNAGTGRHIVQAIANDVKNIVAVESHPVIFSMLKNKLKENRKNRKEEIELYNVSSRSYLRREKSRHDLIILPVINSFGGDAGLHAMQTQYLFTKESLIEMWRSLNSHGVIAVSCWEDYPPRNPLKILATCIGFMEDLGISKFASHIAAVRSWGSIIFLIKRSPLIEKDFKMIRTFCKKMCFDPILLPNIKDHERNHFNVGNQLLEYMDKLLSPEREEFINRYEFNIIPATDNRPYFSQFLKWNSIPYLTELFGKRSIPFFELGYLMVIFTLILLTAAAFILIITPLFSIGWKGEGKLWTICFFSGLGIAYMFVEIVLIQRFNFYFADSVYSTATIISMMLIFSGMGSYFSSQLKKIPGNLMRTLLLIIVLLIIFLPLLGPILRITIALPFVLRLIVTLLIIAPPAFFMGMPFPLGIRVLTEKNENLIPWALGINGCLSVISTVLAKVISVELGFVWVIVFAAMAYGLALLSLFGAKKLYQKKNN